MAKNDLYIQFEKPMTLEEYSSEEGQKRRSDAIKLHRELHAAEDKKQERAAAQRADAAKRRSEVSDRIRAAFQKKTEQERGENEYER
jgi:hypothetical protein